MIATYVSQAHQEPEALVGLGGAVGRRQAWLWAEFADWYPTIKAETWHDAVWVREMVLAQQRHGSPRWAFDGRVLSDTHFKFQGIVPPQKDQRRRMLGPDVVSSEEEPG